MRRLLQLFGCAMVGLLLEARGQCATFVVADVSDTTNLTSLRGAIIAANRLGGTNYILLAQPVYHLTIGGEDEDTALTGDLDITSGNLSILALATNVAV